MRKPGHICDIRAQMVTNWHSMNLTHVKASHHYRLVSFCASHMLPYARRKPRRMENVNSKSPNLVRFLNCLGKRRLDTRDILWLDKLHWNEERKIKRQFITWCMVWCAVHRMDLSRMNDRVLEAQLVGQAKKAAIDINCVILSLIQEVYFW